MTETALVLSTVRTTGSQDTRDRFERVPNVGTIAMTSAELADGDRLELDALVGDDAWRTWANVEREILGEALAPAPLTEAQLDRSVQFKRRQQRETPSIRRFVARYGVNMDEAAEKVVAAAKGL